MTIVVTSKVNSLEIVICHSGLASYVSTNVLLQRMYPEKYIFSMGYSTNASQQVTNTENTDKKLKYITLSKKDRLQRIIKDYGATVVVFHIAISLISLGACYAAVIGLVLQNCYSNYLNNFLYLS